ncbi:hypothetical protein GCM10023176_04430 [Micromonospora coerulea]|uniref:Uncharacterized protein n=1 Tax=Micromonospora coerulea TaxID=47856 RepID=A0ABP8S712_9ACTN
MVRLRLDTTTARPAKVTCPDLPRSARPYGRSFRCAPAAALKSGADVSVTVRLDAKVKTAISSIPKDAWTRIEYTDADYDEQTSRFSRSMSHPRPGRCLHGMTTYQPVVTPRTQEETWSTRPASPRPRSPASRER